jgi:predicted DNA-binding WGR domain protein
MKLIKQTTLHFQDTTSDKIYEVDLCQLGEDRYLVNFRYGRRGSNLKEGTKTDTPVTLPQAEKAFDKLVLEKTKKGYQDITTTPNVTLEKSPSTPLIEISVADPRKQAIWG